MIQLWPLFILLMLANCALNPSPKTANEEVSAPNMDGVAQLFGRFGTAQGCPISDTILFTNAHVADVFPDSMSFPLLSYEFSTDAGQDGKVIPILAAKSRDLAAMEIEEGTFAVYYHRAAAPPQIGERVWFRGYDFRSKKAAYAPRVFSATVTRIVGHHIIMSEAGTPGSSGSCVMNAAGEVVGINSWGKGVGMTGEVGVAVGLWEGI